jgi:ABC-type lipoprotein release transport system permease subunit
LVKELVKCEDPDARHRSLAAPYTKNFLYELKPGDPFTIITAVMMLAAAAFIAAILPARRAARIDPLDALRQN